MTNALAALGDPTRRAIFERLADGPSSVGALAGELPVSRPAVSQHLKVLKAAGLVVDRQAGTRRIYSLEPGRSWASCVPTVERFWIHALGAFKEAAERNEEGS